MTGLSLRAKRWRTPPDTVDDTLQIVPLSEARLASGAHSFKTYAVAYFALAVVEHEDENAERCRWALDRALGVDPFMAEALQMRDRLR